MRYGDSDLHERDSLYLATGMRNGIHEIATSLAQIIFVFLILKFLGTDTCTHTFTY